MKRNRPSRRGRVVHDGVQAFLQAHRATIARELPGARVTVREGPASAFPQARDHARTMYDTRHPKVLVIEVAPRMMRSSRARIAGVLMHELGHAWWIVRGVDDHTERDADTAARRMFRASIRYDRGLVQTTGPGRSPRPRELPQ